MAKSTGRIAFDRPIVEMKRTCDGNRKQPEQAQAECQPPPFELCRMR
jgi:hypothetical protein